MKSKGVFERFAGFCAILAGVSGFLYAVAFIIISRNNPQLGGLLSASFLLSLGFFAIPVVIGVYNRLQEFEKNFALLGLIFGVVGATGAAVHAGFDLANAINPPRVGLPAGVPNLVDPRGLLTFGFTAASLFVFAWLIDKGGKLPKGLGLVGALSALLFTAIYLGRLIVLTPTSPILFYPILLNGFIVNPLWYLWLGMELVGKGRS